MLNEELFDALTPRQKEAIKILASELKMTVDRDMVFAYKNEMYYPTKFGFVNVITVNREKQIVSLKNQLDAEKENNVLLSKDNRIIKDCLKDGGKSLPKIVKIVDGKISDTEKVKQIRKYLETLIRE